MSPKLFYFTSKYPFMFQLLIIFYLALPRETNAGVQGSSGIRRARIGVIIDETTRVGKEQKTAMIIATKKFNDNSHHLKISLRFKNSSYTDPLHAAFSAMELSKEQKVKAIIGMETWQQATLVAEIGSQYKIPILSLAAPPSTLPFASQRWPFLVQMAANYTQQITYIAAMVKSYGWKRVIAVYEDDGYSGTSMMLTLLTQALQDYGSEIEYRLALPPLNVLPTSHIPKEIILRKLLEVLGMQSRVFVVLKCSLPLVGHLFKEAKQIGLVGRENVWVLTESIAGLLESFNSTFISNMQGVLGIKSHFNETHEFLDDFKNKFKTKFQSSYRYEDYYLPSIYAFRAYDGITTIAGAMEKLGANKPGLSEELLDSVLKSNFSGLSGNISFNDQNALSAVPHITVVNVVGKMYKELTLEGGMLKNVDWPGDVRDHIPKGWAMPIDAKPFKIGIPGRAAFDEMVKVEYNEQRNRTTYTGFCIDVFTEALKILEQSYTLPYEFHPVIGTYDDLVESVYNKTFDAVVGDVTILHNRSLKVDFTVPYTASGLWMIVPYESKEYQKAWLLIKPFEWKLWVVTGAIMVYNMFTLWFLEHKSNPEFSGSWKNQLTAPLWFTMFTLFFAHRENIKGNCARIVILVWLVVVLVLTQSYTASFTSMLTVPILEPRVRDINELINSKQAVGCDKDSFLWNYLKESLKIDNRVNSKSVYTYADLFNNHSISAAIIDQTIGRAFLNRYCKDFTHVPLKTNIEGLGFVFQKGSPIARDVSKAILQLSETGVMKSLSDKWFSEPSKCSAPDNHTERLSLQGFWALYLFSGATSTICFLLFLHEIIRSYNRNTEVETDSSDEWISATMAPSLWSSPSTLENVEGRMQELSSQEEVPEFKVSHTEMPEIQLSLVETPDQ